MIYLFTISDYKYPVKCFLGDYYYCIDDKQIYVVDIDEDIYNYITMKPVKADLKYSDTQNKNEYQVYNSREDIDSYIDNILFEKILDKW